MESKAPQVNVFFSWQSDSPSKTNLGFIEDCLKKAVRQIAQENSTVITVDRDTKNVGGSPAIVDTIFQKIRSCDVFVWDATITNNSPRYSPNPNVLIELGYAFAIVGEGRIIGVINEINGIGPDKFPFDLAHRRWPIRYKLDESDPVFSQTKKDEKDNLIKIFKKALQDALKEPKGGINENDIDFYIAKTLWGIIDSEWFKNYLEYKKNNIQYDESKYRDVIAEYIHIATKHENQFVEEELKSIHDALLHALNKYLWIAATEMVPTHGNNKAFVINVKDLARSKGWIENYDEMYAEEVKKLKDGIDTIEKAWHSYILKLRSKFPEITYNV
ncbi:hypothetical protein GKODMF_04150 [Candidatus Electrothrix gigas]